MWQGYHNELKQYYQGIITDKDIDFKNFKKTEMSNFEKTLDLHKSKNQSLQDSIEQLNLVIVNLRQQMLDQAAEHDSHIGKSLIHITIPYRVNQAQNL